jgi:hypothetical protein
LLPSRMAPRSRAPVEKASRRANGALAIDFADAWDYAAANSPSEDLEAELLAAARRGAQLMMMNADLDRERSERSSAAGGYD